MHFYSDIGSSHSKSPFRGRFQTNWRLSCGSPAYMPPRMIRRIISCDQLTRALRAAIPRDMVRAAIRRAQVSPWANLAQPPRAFRPALCDNSRQPVEGQSHFSSFGTIFNRNYSAIINFRSGILKGFREDQIQSSWHFRLKSKSNTNQIAPNQLNLESNNTFAHLKTTKYRFSKLNSFINYLTTKSRFQDKYALLFTNGASFLSTLL